MSEINDDKDTKLCDKEIYVIYSKQYLKTI